MNKKVLLFGTAFSALVASGYASKSFFDLRFTPETAVTQLVKTAAVEAPETVAQDPVYTEIFAAGTTWKYNDLGQNLGTDWKNTNYDDANWQTGASPLGYGDDGMATTLSYGADPDAKHPTYYLRKTITVENGASYDQLRFNMQKDDGAIVYINGQEAFRVNLPATGVTYDTYATENVNGADETVWTEFLTSNLLVDGQNVIAIELHNRSAGSSDLRINLSLEGVTVAEPVDPMLFNSGSAWSYNDQGVDLGTDWRTSTYDDANWATGNAPLGYGDSGMATTLSFGADSGNKYPTYYFRKTITVDTPSAFDMLKFSVQRDDGVAVYVNGVEALRSNMPTGEFNYNTYAPETIDGGAETAWNEYIVPNMLVEGENVIAIELHQRSAGSSDIRLDVKLEGITESETTPDPYVVSNYPVNKDSQWKYSDNGTNMDGQQWFAASNDVTEWSHNYAPLGYGDPVKTIISFGPNPSEKYPTTYFVKDINVNLSDVSYQMELGIRRDDGAIVYINGVEVVRSNMPEGTIGYTTLASSNVNGIDENIYQTYLVPKSALTEGVNRIAVELHNDAVTSSDMRFDFYLKNYVDLSLECNDGHISCFTSIAPTGQTPVLIYPEEHNFQMLFKQGDAYMTMTDANIATVPGLHDYTAYIGINNSSTNGYLSVNHENTPGGVSILNLNLDAATQLWNVTDTRAVDFYNPVLASTTRNCSGGVTPWGTVVTAEETTNSGDNNSDGYQDVGWLVEIDPETAQVRDYGNGQEKLWAMGRMNHENVAISNDGTTAYYGEDGGTHCVYKYIMDTPGDLRNGTVYVLKLDLPLSGQDPSNSTGTWVEVPNDTQADRNNLNNVAVAVGGTSFNGVEDVEIHPINGRIYFTAKGYDRIYDFTDNGMTISDLQTFVGGRSYDIETATGTATEPWGDGNDNLTFDDRGNLWVCQDGGLNYIWMVAPNHSQSQPNVKLWGSMPAGSEPTGLNFSPDYKYGFFSIQHPDGSNAAQVDATGNEITINASASLVFSNKNDIGLSVEDITNSNTGNRVYPNPTNGQLFVELANAQGGNNINIQLFDVTGKAVYSNDSNQTTGGAQRIELNVTPFIEKSSIYILKLEVDGKQESVKVLTK